MASLRGELLLFRAQVESLALLVSAPSSAAGPGVDGAQGSRGAVGVAAAGEVGVDDCMGLKGRDGDDGFDGTVGVDGAKAAEAIDAAALSAAEVAKAAAVEDKAAVAVRAFDEWYDSVTDWRHLPELCGGQRVLEPVPMMSSHPWVRAYRVVGGAVWYRLSTDISNFDPNPRGYALTGQLITGILLNGWLSIPEAPLATEHFSTQMRETG